MHELFVVKYLICCSKEISLKVTRVFFVILVDLIHALLIPVFLLSYAGIGKIKIATKQ